MVAARAHHTCAPCYGPISGSPIKAGSRAPCLTPPSCTICIGMFSKWDPLVGSCSPLGEDSPGSVEPAAGQATLGEGSLAFVEPAADHWNQCPWGNPMLTSGTKMRPHSNNRKRVWVDRWVAVHKLFGHQGPVYRNVAYFVSILICFI